MSVIEIPTRILIADHQEIFVEGLNCLLRNELSIELIIHGTSDKSVQEAIVLHQPNIVLIDADYPEISISSLSNFVHQYSVNSKLIVFSSVQNDQLLLDLLTIGISAFLLKTCKRQELLEAIYAVSNGNTFYCNETTKRMQQLVIEGRYHPHRKNNPLVLSEKEKSILQLICSEYTSKEIADHLNMSLRTVEAYRQSLQEKTGSKNSAGLILYAIRYGIVALKAS